MSHDGNIELMTNLFEKHLDDLKSANEVLETEDQRPINQLVDEAEKLAEAEFFNDNAIKNHGEINREISIVNTDRSVCGRISGEIASIYGNKGFQGQINLKFVGAAGQSFGAFLIQGLNVSLIGEANDYVGKGMNGGRIIIYMGVSQIDKISKTN